MLITLCQVAFYIILLLTFKTNNVKIVSLYNKGEI